MIIKKNNLFFVLVNLILVILSLLLLTIHNQKTWVNASTILYTSFLIFNLYSLYKIHKTFFNIMFLFCLLAYILHISQIYLGFLDIKAWDNIFRLIDFNSNKIAFTYSFLAISIVLITYFFTLNLTKISKKQVQINLYDKNFIRYAFYILYSFKLYYKFSQVTVSIQSEYSEALAMVSSFSIMLCTFAEVFSILYIKYIAKRKNILFMFLIALEFFFMLTGNRIYSIVYILAICLFFYSEIFSEKFTFKKKIILFIVTLFSLVVIVGVKEARLDGFVNLETLIQNIRESNIIIDLFKELGFTQVDMAIAIKYQDSINYSKGISYLFSIFTIFPNFNGFYDNLLPIFYFINELKKFFYLNMGGSFICETFMNFKYLGLLVFVGVGYFISRFENKVRNLKSLTFPKQVFIIAFTIRLFLWERGYFYGLLRIPIWLYLICQIYHIIFLKFKTKN